MQVIRLSRTGRHKYPLYRIVTADKRRAATGKYINVLGHYNPHTKELVIHKDELTAAVAQGAQPSNAVLKLMQKDGMKLPKWATIETRNRKPKKTEEKAETKPEAAAGEAEAEAKAEATDEKADEVKAVDEKSEPAETTPEPEPEAPTEK